MDNSSISELNLEQRLQRIEDLLQAQAFLNKEILDMHELALYTCYSKMYLYRLTSQNIIPYYKPNGKSIRFRRQEIDNWLLSNRVATIEETEQEGANFAVLSK